MCTDEPTKHMRKQYKKQRTDKDRSTTWRTTSRRCNDIYEIRRTTIVDGRTRQRQARPRSTAQGVQPATAHSQ
eukprot:6479289-Amphidinium_carterae.1